MNVVVGGDFQRQVTAISDELRILQLRCEELEERTRAEDNRRKVWEECLEDQMRGSDWSTYTEELAAASQEIKAWRLNIEDEREHFVTSMKSELQDMLLKHIDKRIDEKSDMMVSLLPAAMQKSETMNGVPDGVVDPTAISKEQLQSDFQRFDQRLDHLSNELHDEIEGLNAKLQEEVKALSTKVATCQPPDKQGGADPPVEWTLQQLSMRILELRQDAKGYAMAEDVTKLGEQVQESHPLLFDMGVRLTDVENELEAEREARTAAIEDVSRKVDLVETVFNAGKVDKSERPAVSGVSAEDALDTNERHDRFVRHLLEQVDNMAKFQLNAIRERLEQEEAARQRDVQLIWSSLQADPTHPSRQQVPSFVDASPTPMGHQLPLSAVPPALSERRAFRPGEESSILSSRVVSDVSRGLPSDQMCSLEGRSLTPGKEGKPGVRLASESRQVAFDHSPSMQQASRASALQQGAIGSYGNSLSAPLGNTPFVLPVGSGLANHGLPSSSPVTLNAMTMGDHEGAIGGSVRTPLRPSSNLGNLHLSNLDSRRENSRS